MNQGNSRKKRKQDRKCSNKNNNSNNNDNNNNIENNKRLSATEPVITPRLRVGFSGTFLLQYSTKEYFQYSLLESNDIVGNMPTEQHNPEVYNKLRVVSEFLRQHSLAVAAESSTGFTGSVQSSNTEDVTIGTVPVLAASFYMPTVNDFAITQLDRQAAGLRTNTKKESVTGLTDLVNGHVAAMKAAMEHSSGNEGIYDDSMRIGNCFGLSKNLLCSLHSLLSPSNTQFGKFRTTQAKAGNTFFCPAGKIDSEMESLFALLESLWPSWLQQKRTNQSSCSTMMVAMMRETYHAVSLAALLMYCINDIHPFVDGNGRMARICANYTLRRTLGLPFTLTLVATEVHRQEYIDGLKKADMTLQRLKDLNNVQSSSTQCSSKSNLVSSSHDKNRTQSASSQSTSSSSTSALELLIHMILDRMAHAIHQLQQQLDKRARAATEDEENRIARVVRERAAQGQCMICLDERPNIATLCCGGAVHLNCIAEWLANQKTCVNCRGPLPQLVHPVAHAAPAADDTNTTTLTDIMIEYEHSGTTTTSSSSSLSSSTTSTSIDSSSTDISRKKQLTFIHIISHVFLISWLVWFSSIRN